MNQLLSAISTRQSESVIQDLLTSQQIDLNLWDPYDEGPLLLASRTGQTSVVRLLLEFGADLSRTYPPVSFSMSEGNAFN